MDEQALLRAIVADPGDDTVRLAYADWCAENGKEDRGAFIRVQIELARLAKDDPRREGLIAREAELFEVLRQEQLRSELPPELYRYGAHNVGHYRRGFFAMVYVSSQPTEWAAFRALVPALFARTPVEELWLGPDTEIDWNSNQVYSAYIGAGNIQELRDLTELARLTALHISSPVLDIDAVSRAILANPHFRRLRKLHFQNRYPTNDTMNGWANDNDAEAFLVDRLAPETQVALRAAFGDRVTWDE